MIPERANDGGELAPPAAPPRLDALGLQELLEARVEKKPASPPFVDAPLPDPQKGGNRRAGVRGLSWRVVKLGLAVAALVPLSFTPLKNMLQTSSVEAIVNARIVSVRAPIDGVVRRGSAAASLGAIVEFGQQILEVQNVRADSGRLDDIRRAAGRLADERPALVARLDSAKRALDEVSRQVEVFRDGRRRELDAKLREYTANVAAARAKTKQAEDTARRYLKLVAKNFVSQIEFEQAQTNVAVAQAAEAASVHQLESFAVEREAVDKGVYVSDTYNDRPTSLQRAEELAQRICDLKADLDAQDAQAERLDREMRSEAEKFNVKAGVAVTAPIRGRVFDIMAAAGEEVHRGQDLVRLIDCSETVVTATVSEAVYNRLHVGAQARFHLANERSDREGVIISLTGSSDTISAAMAIHPTSEIKEKYRVTVAVPGLEDAASCNIGRTGKVVFETGSHI